MGPGSLIIGRGISGKPGGFPGNCPEKIEVIELRRIVQKEKGESGKSTASKRGTYQKSLAAERAPDIHDRLGCEVEMDRPSDTVLSGGSYQKIVY